jgi:predicted aspartyl protease
MTVGLSYEGQSIEIQDVLVDTGSASTLFAADAVAAISLFPQPTDELRLIRGVGGTEAVFSRTIDNVEVGGRQLAQFEIEIAGMDYGFAINGILGMDFLTRTGAIIDLAKMQIEFTNL